MTWDTGQSTFLTHLKKVGTICRKHGEETLFTDFVVSFPTGDTNNTIEQFKTEQNPSRRHRKTPKTEIGTKHEISRKDSRNNNEIVSGDAKKSRINTKDEVCKKDKDYQSRLIKCMFCNTKRVHINNHYLTVHKLDFNVWVKNLSQDNRGNATVCPQCNKDYRNSTAFREHLSNYHNIQLDKNRRRLKKKDAHEHEDMLAKENDGDRVRVGAVKKKTPIQEDGNESSDEEREMQTETVSRGDKVENTNGHQNVKERCKQCGEFIEVASFDSHVASHAKERETFTFKTKKAKNHSNSLNDTLKKTGQRKEGGNLVSNRGFISDDETNNVNHDNLIGNKTNLAGNLVKTNVANESEEDSRLDHASGSQDSETIRMDIPRNITKEKLNSEAVSIEEKVKRYRKQLWREFFARMRNEDPVVQEELYEQFLLVYKDTVPKYLTCFERLTRR